MYDPDDGPGCGHSSHQATCLCDVHLELLKLPLPPKRHTRDDWEYEYEVMYGDARRARRNAPIVRDARALWHDTHAHTPKGRGSTRSRAVRALMAHGYELDEVALAFDASEREVIHAVLRNSDHVPVERMRWVMDEMRRGETSYKKLAIEVGLDGSQLTRLGRVMGLPNRGRASSAKYGEEMYRKALRLREEGKTWAQIAHLLGLRDANAAYGLVRRSARFTSMASA